jgi:hypothetical protein
MPLPKPKKDENREDFIERCMSDDNMKKEFPDTKQRYAVCSTLWEENKGKRG